MAERSFPCPCCHFSTLNEPARYEICPICWWEDDGQDDPQADETWGGPNGRYSLTEARWNFADHLHMYDAGDGIAVVEYPNEHRVALLAYVSDVLDGDAELNPKRLAALLAMPQSPHRPLPFSSP